MRWSKLLTLNKNRYRSCFWSSQKRTDPHFSREKLLTSSFFCPQNSFWTSEKDSQRKAEELLEDIDFGRWDSPEPPSKWKGNYNFLLGNRNRASGIRDALTWCIPTILSTSSGDSLASLERSLRSQVVTFRWASWECWPRSSLSAVHTAPDGARQYRLR